MKRAWFFPCCLAGLSVVMLGPLGVRAQDQTMAPMTEHAHAPTVPSTSLTLAVDGKATTPTVAELEAMPQKTVTVHNEHTKLEETYSGVALGELLAKYGFPVDKTTHRKMLRSYIVAEGMDKYWVLYSVTEVEASEHNGDVIVATSMGGKPLGEDGALKLVDSGDKRPERWVRNLSAITVKSAE
ncbi:molybdopterin-dependent oxidoreductase [Granulicella sp. L60]|uniref:molybdopterin-dependent oxidoreductase n=1 Tax=Granulicella sp. L60 TaxID=1641866 RepID=UPI00131DCCAE|nr:molybdopterin-dependent oxidoreductase [Granulicella sp. L60]